MIKKSQQTDPRNWPIYGQDCILHEKYEIPKSVVILPSIKLSDISDKESAVFFDKFLSDYQDKVKLVKILLCPSKEKLSSYLPKIIMDRNIHVVLTEFWQYYILNYWNRHLNVELDSIEKIFIVFEANTGMKLRNNQKNAFREICKSL